MALKTNHSARVSTISTFPFQLSQWNFLVAAFEIWINFMSSYCTLIFSVLEGLEN